MIKDPTQELITAVVRSAFEAIKEGLSSQQPLSASELVATVAARPEVKTVQRQVLLQLDAAEEAARSATALEDELTKAHGQKNTLLKQATQLEDNLAAYRKLLQQVVAVIAGLLPSGTEMALLKQLQRFIREGVEPKDLQTPVRQLKDALIHSEPPVPETSRPPTTPPGRLARWLGGKGPRPALAQDAIASLRHAARQMVDGLRLNVGREEFERVGLIEGRVERIDSLAAYLQLQNEVLVLLQDFSARISHERAQAAGVLREIGQRLAEIESHLLDSLALARDARQHRRQFSSQLEEQVEALSGSVNFSQTLAELKQAVVSRIMVIRQAIEQQSQSEQQQLQHVDSQMGVLQQDVEHMKQKIASAQARAAALEQELLLDPLTGIYNRRAYEKRMADELQRFIRYQQRFSILVLDVDLFKQINDRYGHAIGDRCLQEIVRRVRPVLRQCDFLARYGGEEFVVLLPGTGAEQAVAVAEKLRCLIEQTEFLHKKDKVAVTISIGVAEVHKQDRQPEMLFERADKALYEAKRTGRNRVVRF